MGGAYTPTNANAPIGCSTMKRIQAKLSSARNGITTNVLAFIIGVLFSLLQVLEFIEKRDFVYACYFLSAMGVLLVVGSYLSEITLKLSEAVDEYNLSEALPTFLKISSRKDTFELQRDGTAILQWEFLVEADLASINYGINEFSLPIYFERNPNITTDNEIALEVISLSVDQRSLPTTQLYVPREIRKSLNNKEALPTEFGSLMIPVGLTQKNSRCRIDLTVRLKGAFSNLFHSEYAIIDMPYITEYISVTVLPPPGCLIHKLPENQMLIVTSVQAENIDLEETLAKRSDIVVNDNRFTWETKFPKLGYRYRLYFRVSDNESPPKLPSPTPLSSVEGFKELLTGSEESSENSQTQKNICVTA